MVAVERVGRSGKSALPDAARGWRCAADDAATRRESRARARTRHRRASGRARRPRGRDIFPTTAPCRSGPGSRMGGGADGVPRACARTRDRRDATRNEGDVNTHRRATLLCATPLTARVRSGRRAGSASRCELARTAQAESVDPRFFVRLRRHTTREHKMCSSCEKQKDDPQPLTRQPSVGSRRAARSPPFAAARAPRSIARVSPPPAPHRHPTRHEKRDVFFALFPIPIIPRGSCPGTPS